MLRGITRNGFGGLALLLAIVLLAAGPASAAGFSIFEAGSRATGMGGAFVGVADDQSAMFYNPAGLGEQAEKGKLKAMVGVTLIMPELQARPRAPTPTRARATRPSRSR